MGLILRPRVSYWGNRPWGLGFQTEAVGIILRQGVSYWCHWSHIEVIVPILWPWVLNWGPVSDTEAICPILRPWVSNWGHVSQTEAMGLILSVLVSYWGYGSHTEVIGVILKPCVSKWGHGSHTEVMGVILRIWVSYRGHKGPYWGNISPNEAMGLIPKPPEATQEIIHWRCQVNFNEWSLLAKIFPILYTLNESQLWALVFSRNVSAAVTSIHNIQKCENCCLIMQVPLQLLVTSLHCISTNLQMVFDKKTWNSLDLDKIIRRSYMGLLPTQWWQFH